MKRSQSNLSKTSPFSLTSFCLITILLLLLLLSNVTCTDWWSTNSQWGSYTPYHGGSDANFGISNDNECQLVYVFGYFRHGTRLPTESVTLKLPDIANKAKSTCSTGKSRKRYCHPYEEPIDYKATAGALTNVGKDELYNIGVRLQKVINPDTENIQLFLSKAQRAKDSAISFFRGFNLNIQPNEKNNDDDLVRYYRPYKIKKSKKDDFSTSDTWKNTLESIGKVVAFPTGKAEVKAMYGACSLGVNNKYTDEVQMWCPMLPQSALDAILYEEDARNYWQYETNPPNMTDALLHVYSKDIQKLTDEIKNSKEPIKPRVTLLFGHHGGVFPIIKRLKFYQQKEPLNAENYQKLVKNRDFNNTLLTPMASNVQLHVYYCKNTKQLYFHPYLNEKSMLHTVDCKEKKTSFGCPQDKFSSIYDSNHNPMKMNFVLLTAACFTNIFIAI